MRVALITAASACVLISACGGSGTSQANNAEANISNTAAPPSTANVTGNAMVMLATAPTKEQALKIMHDRHEAMEGLGKAMKALHRSLESRTPDINVIRAQTLTMASTAAKIPSFFPAGTGPDVGKTRAKPEIWKQQDVFLRKSKDFLAAAQTIDAAAKAGDLNRVMAAHDSVDKACKACHDSFRAPEH